MTPAFKTPAGATAGLPDDAATEDGWREAMLAGRFEEAWAISDRVVAARGGTDAWHLPRHLRWCWDGTPLAGRHLLVRCYHGLGDTIQMARFLPRLKRLARSLTIQAQEALHPILSASLPADRWLGMDEGDAWTGHEVAVESMEIPHALRLDPGELPGPVPYLAVPSDRVAERRRAFRRPGKRSIGIVCAGGDWDPRRAIDPALLALLAARRDVALFSFQRGPAADRVLAALGDHIGNPEDRSEDVLDTAVDMMAVEQVITIDSMTAHLSGALGVSTSALLHADADWRWMRDRPETPWYPTMRLFRQPAPGNWEPVVAALLGRAV